MSVFVLIGGLQETGVISDISGLLEVVVGKNIALGTLVLLFATGLASSMIPNIPLVVAMVPLLKEYLVNVNLVAPEVFAADAVNSVPPEILPLFAAMMFGATLGGNGTLVGASSNIVAAGIAEQHGKTISFHGFLRYGLPVMAVQLVAVSLFVAVRFL
jgi:Na+/H+ antiporter NhaD/arsenite permease-like protein